MRCGLICNQCKVSQEHQEGGQSGRVIAIEQLWSAVTAQTREKNNESLMGRVFITQWTPAAGHTALDCTSKQRQMSSSSKRTLKDNDLVFVLWFTRTFIIRGQLALRFHFAHTSLPAVTFPSPSVHADDSEGADEM